MAGLLCSVLYKFRNILYFAVERGTKLIKRFGFYVVVRFESADGFTVNTALFSQNIRGNSLFLHRFPKLIKNYHKSKTSLTFIIMGIIITNIKGI